MYRKLMFLISLVCLLGLSLPASAEEFEVDWGETYTVSGTEEYDDMDCGGTVIIPTGATLILNGRSRVDGDGPDGPGGSQYAKLVVDGGTFIMNYRLDLGCYHDAYLIVQNGGSVIHTESKIAIPDEDDGVHRLIIIDGTVVANEIDVSYDDSRYAGIQIACSPTPGVIVAKLTVGNADDGDNYDPETWITYDINEGINDLGDDWKEVFYFTSPEHAWGPSPEDGATGVHAAVSDVELCWEPGTVMTPAGRHLVYFGTDEEAVDLAGTGDPEFKGLLGATVLCKNMGPLPLGEPLWSTYYWRIDEFVAGLTTKGPVWSFTTGCEDLPGDTNDDCLLNFLDYADVAGTWQMEQFWPEPE